MPIDYSTMTDEELLGARDQEAVTPTPLPSSNIISEAFTTVSDFTDNVLQGGEDLGVSIGAGVESGLAEAVDRTTLAGKELLDLVGLTDPESTEVLRTGIGAARTEREKTISEQEFPTVAKGAAFVSEVGAEIAGAGKLLRPLKAAGTLASVVGQSALIGAVSNEKNRTLGALTGAGFGAAGAAVGKVAGSVKVQTATKRIRDQVAKLMPEGKVFSHADDFERLLLTRETKAASVADKLLTRAFKGKAGTTTSEFSTSKSLYEAARDKLAGSRITAVKQAVDELDDVFAGRISLRDAKELVVGNGRLNDTIKPLWSKSPAAAKVVAQVKNSMRKELETKLETISPQAFKQFKKGMEVSKFKIADLESKEITKSIRAGDFNALTSQLSKPTGGKVLRKITKAIGPKGEDIIQKGLLKNAYLRSFNDAGSFNADKFLSTFNKIKNNSGLTMNKTTTEAFKRVAKLNRKLPTGIPGSSGVIKEGINFLLSSRPGIAIITSSKAKSIDDLFRIASQIGTAITAKQNKPADFSKMSDEELLELKGSIDIKE